MRLIRHLPNVLTLLRMALILPFGLAVHDGRFDSALIVFFIAGLTDAVDGFLAREFNWRSRFGAIADPIADKLLLITAYVMLAHGGQIEGWLAVLVLGRDIVILLGALAYHFFVSHYDIRPSLWGKLCTLVQILFVLMVIIDLGMMPIAHVVLLVAQWVVVGTTLVSGLNYVVVWSLKARKIK